MEINIIQIHNRNYNNFVSVLQLNSEQKNRKNMFDENKVKQLQNKSHVRGKLNKQFYSSEQEELQKKRREMKYILDQQVEERRRQKDRQKLQNQRKMQQQEEKIKAYYAQIEDRQKKVYMVNNNSGHGYLQNSNSNVKNFNGSKNNGSGVYESRASNFNQENSNFNNHFKQNGSNYRSKSKTQYQNDSGDIPVMPLMQSLQKQKDKQKNYHVHDKQKERDRLLVHKNSAGNIPLLQLTLDEQKREKKKSKRNPTKMNQKQKEKEKNEKNEKMEKKEQKEKMKQRKQTVPDEQFYINSRQQTQFKEVFGDLNEQLEEQNKQLKKQLKKKQQAISLLMGAVRSNVKLDKFRVQAEKILHGQNSLDTKLAPVTHNQNGRKESKNGQYQANDSKQKQSMFPRLKLKHQSIMHDYMFGSARRAQAIKSKTFK